MGTRSRIGVMHGDNVKSVYCHWDGYLEHNGEILQKHYDSVKANQLVSLGDLSSLKENIGTKHAFSTFDLSPAEQEAYEVEHGESCTFYGRDRGEENTGYKVHTNFEDFIECVEGSWCEWYYIMKDGVWYVGNIYSGDKYYKTLTPLTEALAAVEEAA
jgi:hypothetical protein